jgi:azurin
VVHFNGCSEIGNTADILNLCSQKIDQTEQIDFDTLTLQLSHACKNNPVAGLRKMFWFQDDVVDGGRL